jgi:hypothetical protein
MKKEQFLRSVFLGALYRDIHGETNKLHSIMFVAAQIPEEAIPPVIENAAQVFLAFCHGITDSEFKWFYKREPFVMPPAPIENVIVLHDWLQLSRKAA